MQKALIPSFIVFFISIQLFYAQKPQKPNSVEIYNQIQKLNFLGSILYIAAHPDDENTRLISYFSNETKAKTAYLSLTRGDGGQNLIGSELRELLGVIRTQELIEARKIDGGEQFFSRANDFGFSKKPEETLQIWDKEKVLADVIWAIRKFQPDIIINRFDHRTSGTTHGHHSASALLSVESFNLTNNTNVFPDQLKLVQPWQVKRQFFNPSWYFFGSKEKFAAADKSNYITFQTGVYYQSIGKSNQEIAALSRSCHQSQGFGSTGVRGEETEYLELINGEAPADKTNLFDGIDTSWNRVKGGKSIGELVTKIIAQYDFKNPDNSIPDLLRVYSMILALDENHWKPLKLEELKTIISSCTGLYLEANASNQECTPGSQLKIQLEAINRSAISMNLESITILPSSEKTIQNLVLQNNVLKSISINIQLPSNLEYTQPYWLKEKGDVGMYTVNSQSEIGLPDIKRQVKIVFNLTINGIKIPFERTVIYKYTDDVKGEVYNYLDIIPYITSTIIDKVTVFKNKNSRTIDVKIKSGKELLSGELQLELPKNWTVFPKSIPFKLDKKGMEQIVSFEVTPPNQNDDAIAKSIVFIDGKRFDKDQVIIDYNHISKQQVLKPAEAKLIRIDLNTNDEKIAYIMGAGDEVPNGIKQMGYSVTLLNPEEISIEKLNQFDVIITGIRAYNMLQTLENKQDILFELVKNGKTMLVQYNTTADIITQNIAPYPLKISNDRVTEENAEVRFLAPDHPALNYPNKITLKDFEGWKQEQGLYYPKEFDSAFTPIISSNDKGESPKNGAILVAKYGKGYYVYTGLSFFRELPEGVSGAYRLLANLISLKKSESNTIQK
ncbi:PIG-L family deacetylase [Flavobacterium sp.]|uniref:PIG-L family deacetylase n=1 Tax=Flavobacterium sp. TaxID=239 RepID=UPI0038FBF55F